MSSDAQDEAGSERILPETSARIGRRRRRRVMRSSLVVAVVALAACRHADAPRVAAGGPIHNVAPVDPGAGGIEPDPEPDDDTIGVFLEDGPEEDGFRGHVERGRAAYHHGDFQRAIDEFQLAYQARAHPALLYNIAQAYRLLGDPQRALFFYKRYLAIDPDATNHAKVEQIITDLEQQP